jgi:putative ABC transport system permease protein
MKTFDDHLMAFLDDPVNVVVAGVALLLVLVAWLYRDGLFFYARLITKSLFRNFVRSLLTSLAVLVLVLVVTAIWTVLTTLNRVTTEKSRDFKVIVTERWQLPSQMPEAYASSVPREVKTKQEDHMYWSFFGGTIDPTKMTRENIVFFFGMDPDKVMKAERDDRGNLVRDRDGRPRFTSMLDGVDELSDEDIDLLDRACREMKKDKRKVVIGKERLAALQKKVGEKMTVTSFNYRGIDLEVEIIGSFPDGRYNQNAVVNFEYISEALASYKTKNRGQPHPMADKCINLVWLRVPDTETFREVADKVMESPKFTSPAVKCETASSGVASFLDAYRSLLWGMQWLLVPAILATMAVVIANAISISVRERRTEMAVLKVLGFGPTQVMVLVLGEAVLIGALSGFVSSALAYGAINAQGGVKFPIAFFPAFRVPVAALWWGVSIGGLTALAGSILPAWSARSIKAAEVFAKIS